MKTVMENITESDKEYRKLPYEVKALIDEKRLHIKKISRIQEIGKQVNEIDCFNKSYCNALPGSNTCMKKIYHDFSSKNLIMKLAMLSKQELDDYQIEGGETRRFGDIWMLLPKNETNVKLIQQIQETWGYSSVRKQRILDKAIWKLYENHVRKRKEISFNRWIIEKTQEESNHRFYRCFMCQNVNFK